MSGTDKIDAANELRAFANRFRGVLACADDLEKIGSLENAAVEIQSRVDGLKLQEEAAKERIAKMGLEFAEAQKEARASANKLIDDAKAEAAVVKQAAEEAAAATRESAAKDLAEATQKLAARNAEIAGANATLGAVKHEIAHETDKLEGIKAEIAKLRAKF